MKFKFHTDTLFDDETSVQDNKCSQLYDDRDVFLHVSTMRSKAVAGESLVNGVKDIGIMNEIHCENALEQVGTNSEFISKFRKYNISVSFTDPYSPWHSKDEKQIQTIKGRAHKRT